MSQPKVNPGFVNVETEWLKFMLLFCKDEIKTARIINQDELLFAPFHHTSPNFVDRVIFVDDEALGAVDDVRTTIAYFSAQVLLYMPFKYAPHFYNLLSTMGKLSSKLQEYQMQYPVIEKAAHIFTDGASDVRTKPRKAGWAFYYSIGNKNIVGYGPLAQQRDDSGSLLEKTNNQAEGIAIIKALNFLNNNRIKCKVILVTDSQLYVKIIKQYMHTWYEQDRQFKCNTSSGTPVKNAAIIREIYRLYMERIAKFELDIVHVHSHRKAPNDLDSYEYKLWAGNNIADKYACEGRESLDEKEFRLDSKKYKLSVEATVNSGPK
jgi:ribonuclease HI